MLGSFVMFCREHYIGWSLTLNTAAGNVNWVDTVNVVYLRFLYFLSVSPGSLQNSNLRYTTNISIGVTWCVCYNFCNGFKKSLVSWDDIYQTLEQCKSAIIKYPLSLPIPHDTSPEHWLLLKEVNIYRNMIKPDTVLYI